MTNLTMNIAPDGQETQHKAKGTPKSTDPGAGTGNAAFLNQNDGLVLEIGGFDTGSEIAEVHVYSDANETNQIGQWTRSNGETGLSGIFTVSTTGSSNVTLSDAESPGSNTDRWYKVKVTSGLKFWWMDPEVVNKAGGNKTGGASWGSST